ncbi:30S ribosomal protein S5 [bacterium]|nr:30S ribosomal protein S5 [bacterium]MBU1598780.1 30S ribosomal protein S5 [bacterium]MBU2461282.1 30S ribosomal protein S5 [bacterium]
MEKKVNLIKESSLSEKVLLIRRVTKVVKGGKKMHFSALVIVGDGAGRCGIGMGKANEVPKAIKKAIVRAQKQMIKIPLAGPTLLYNVTAKKGASIIMLKPASPGTGIIGGGSVRAVLEALGVKDAITKSMKSNNPINVVKATMEGLRMIKTIYERNAMRRELEEVSA